MNKAEYLKKLDELNLDKNRYCIISAGVMLLYGLKKSTEDIDIKVKPDYFEELKSRFEFKKSLKYPYLYEINDEIEVAVLDYNKSDVKIVDGYPVESLELQLKWFMEHNRPKDMEKIRIIRDFLNRGKIEKKNDKMIKILFATGNEAKAKRFSKKLLEKGIEIITLKDINIDMVVEENGKDAIENALIKARAYSKIINIPVFAMDDNLYLENVPEEKQPGIYVRRVKGKKLSDEEMIDHYINLVKTYGTDGKLTCRWVYGMAVINNEKESTYSWSKEDFYMVDKPSNKVIPGYPLNTISINKKLNKYFTDITEEDKALLHEDESEVVDFIANSIKD